MELVGQMYKLSACFDTPNEYKGLPYDYFPEDAVSYGSTICSFGLPYNDHNYGMPTGLTPPVMAPHLMDPVTKPKKTINDLFAKTKTEPTCEFELTVPQQLSNQFISTDSPDPSSNCTPRKQYLDENDYPVYVEPEIKVVEVPDNLCVSASEYSDCSSESSDDTKVNPEFLIYLRSMPTRHVSVERYLSRARRQYEQYAHSQKSSGSEKRDCSMTSDSVIDCICEYSYDDKRMVQCESCGVKQHLDCMYANPRQVPNFLKHRCHKCSDIKVDVSRAKAIQYSRKNWHTSTANQHQPSSAGPVTGGTAAGTGSGNTLVGAGHAGTGAERAGLSKSSRPSKTGATGAEHEHRGSKHRDSLFRIRDTKVETVTKNGGPPRNTPMMARVNKRKQDLKVYGDQDAPDSGTATMATVPVLSAAAGSADIQLVMVRSPSVVPALSESGALSTATEPAVEPDSSLPSNGDYQECDASNIVSLGSATVASGDGLATVADEAGTVAMTTAMAPATTAATTSNSSSAAVGPERVATATTAIMNRRNAPFKKDYKEATKSLYTSALLAKVTELQESEEEKQSLLANVVADGLLEQGTEFLDRNPRCRIVLFDGCTMGLEASVRLQGCSIVSAMIGRMMLMEEYLKYASPAAEYRPFVFLYHGFADHGLVIDTTVYGNISRYLRRSCDPNVKLEHTIIGGSLYVVVRTTTEIFQGVELTIPFDLPFEICQYPVQCACGKVRCPAIKHRRKHHRNRIITSNINCEQVIEDKLRELSQPLCSSNGAGGGGAYNSGSVSAGLLKKAPMIASRFGGMLQSRQGGSGPDDWLETKPSVFQGVVTEDRIKLEEQEPPASLSDQQQQEASSPNSGPPRRADLSGTAILTTKRKPKPVRHPDFELSSNPTFGRERSRSRPQPQSHHQHQLHRTGSTGNSASGSNEPNTLKPKSEPVTRKIGSDATSCSSSKSPGKISNKETPAFKSIITTRQQKLNKSSIHSNKRSRLPKVDSLDQDSPTKRSNRSKK